MFKLQEIITRSTPVSILVKAENDVIQGRVSSIIEEGVVVAFNNNSENDLPQEAQVSVEIMCADDAAYKGEATIKKCIYHTTLAFCILKDLNNFIRTQRRSFVRVSTDIVVSFSCFTYHDYQEGKFIDISGEGALLVSPKPLNINQELYLKFALKIKEYEHSFNLKAKVVREADSSLDQSYFPYKYGIEFIDLTINQQNYIGKYIFEALRVRVKSI